MHRFPETSFKLAVSNSEILDKYLDEAVANRNYKDYIRWLLLNFCLNESVSRIKSLTLEEVDKNRSKNEGKQGRENRKK